MAIVRKVHSQLNKTGSEPASEQVSQTDGRRPAAEKVSTDKKTTPRKKVCFFCKNHIKPSYADANLLRKFTSDRGRIYPRTRSGSCAKHQRRVSTEIKRARHLALLPFIIRA